MSLANGSGNVGFIASNAAGTANYTWPTSVAGGNFLQTDASGNLSWASVGGGGDFFKNGSVNMTGAFVAQPGTASAPGLTFVGDTSTGVFQPASSAVAVSIAGSEKMRINASGNVGIGTNAPSVSLDVSGQIKTPQGSGGGYLFPAFSAATQGIFSNSGSNDISISPFYDGLFAPSNSTGRFRPSNDNASGLGTPGQRWAYLFVGTGNSSFAGNVGVGTTTPTSKLSVNGSMSLANGSGNVGFIASSSAGTANYTWPTAVAGGNFLQTDASGNLSWASIGGGGDFFKNGSVAMTGALVHQPGTAAAPGLTFVGDTSTGVFQPASSAVAVSIAGSEKMRINASGYVGIGTTAPNTELDVNLATNTTTDIFDVSYVGTPFFKIARDSASGYNNLVSTARSHNFGALQPTDWTTTTMFVKSPSTTSKTLALEKTPGQSADLMQIRNSGATTGDLVTVNASGYLGVGVVSPTAYIDVSGNVPAAGASLRVTSTATNSNAVESLVNAGAVTAPSSAPGSAYESSAIRGNNWTNSANLNANTSVIGMYGIVQNNNNSTPQNLYGVWGRASGAATNTSAVAGAIQVSGNTGTGSIFSGFLQNTGSGTVSSANGVNVSVSNTSTGTITNGYGVNIGAPGNSGGGGFSNYYGVYISTPTVASSNYAFYSQGGDNYFGGNVGIGMTPAASAVLSAKGAVRLYGATSGYNGFVASAVAGSTVWTLPVNDGTNGQVLTTNGAGQLAWTTAGGGSGDFKADGSVNMTGTLKHIAGTVAAPGSTFVGDTSTGFFQPASSTVGVAVGGAEKLRVNASGYVGVGTSSPSSLLDVAGAVNVAYGTSAAPSLGFENDTGTGFYHTASGITGYSSLGVAKFTMSTGLTSTSNFGFQVNTGAGSAAAPTFTFHGEAVSGMWQPSFGNIAFSASGVEVVRMTASGNVGIGTITPAAKLSVNGSMVVMGSTSGYNGFVASAVAGSTVWTLPVNDGTSGQVLTTNGSGQLAWTTAGGGSGDFMKNGSVNMTGNFVAQPGTAASPGVTFVGDTTTGTFQPASSNLGWSVAGAEKMRINASGYVGIGTTSPTYGLEVKVVASGTVSSFAARANPGATGSTYYNSVLFDNLYGAGNFKNQFIMASNGTPKWALGNDVTGLGVQNFFIWDGAANNNRLLIDAAGAVQTGASGVFGFASNVDPKNASLDTGMSRIGVATMAIGNGTNGNTTGTLIAGKVGIGTSSPAARLSVNGSMVVMGSTSGYSGFVASAVAGSTIWTLPTADGTNGQVLTTNGSGVLTWTTASGGVSTTTTSAASPVDLNALTASVLDWNLGAQTNVVFNVKNMVNGVTYTAALRGSASGTTTVNCYSDGGSTALTPTFLPANSTRAGSASMYSIQRVGSYCYITWSTGWN